MVDALGTLLTYIFDFLKHEVVIDGYTISLWQVFIFICVSGIICYVIGEMFDFE